MAFGGFNTINSALTDSCIGSVNKIEISENNRGSNFANHCSGYSNIITTTTGKIRQIGNNVGGIGNTASDTQAIHISGSGNTANNCINVNIGCISNKVNSTVASSINGAGNRVGILKDNRAFDLRVITVEGLLNKVQFKGEDFREGANMTGRKGYFLFNENKISAEDTYNYSNQLAGGGPLQSEYYGEGISMIDRTIVNGVYPLGKHQSYLNTSDGTNYAIMMKSDKILKMGTFVSLTTKCHHCFKDPYEKILTSANNNDDVIGVITKSAGFIANAGQFAASERIEYDDFNNPKIELNISNISNNITSLRDENMKHDVSILNDIQENEEVQETQIKSPAFLTVLKSDVDRSIPFVPFDERSNYYQVALSGLVVVRAKFTKQDLLKINKCDVKKGRAIPGNKYWIVKIIDNKHLQILL